MDPSLVFDHGVSQGQLLTIDPRKIDRRSRMCESGMTYLLIQSPRRYERSAKVSLLEWGEMRDRQALT